MGRSLLCLNHCAARAQIGSSKYPFLAHLLLLTPAVLCSIYSHSLCRRLVYTLYVIEFIVS